MFVPDPCAPAFDLCHPRFSRGDTLFFASGRGVDCLTAWPRLASFTKPRQYGCEWAPNPSAGNRVIAAYRTPNLSLDTWRGLPCETETGQTMLPAMLTLCRDRFAYDPARDYALSRIRAQREEFVRAIPPEVADLVAEFRYNQVALLRLLAVCPETTTLVRANPAAAFELACLFDGPEADPANRQTILRLLHGPQRKIFSLRGLPATESARRLFRKLPPAKVCTWRLRLLGQALSHPMIGRWLPHEREPAFLTPLLRDPTIWTYLNPALANDLIRRLRRPLSPEDLDLMEYFSHYLADETVTKLRWFDRQVRHGKASPRVFKSLGDILSLEVPNALRSLDDRATLATFPPPRFPGTTKVIPLTTPAELDEEGKVQRNCIGGAGYRTMIARGTAYAYRVLAPERCTTIIEHITDGKRRGGWQITDVRTFGDALPNLSTIQAISDALGLPARPSWLTDGCWWSEHPVFLCVPRRSTVVQPLPAGSRQ